VELPETVCARARESVSAQLDGELSAHELDHLENHLLICPECSAWAEQARNVTARLREAVLEVPAERFGFSRRPPGWRVGSAVALASAADVVATMFFAPGHPGAVARHRVSVSRVAGAAAQQVEVPRLWLEDGLYSPVSAVGGSQIRFRPV
jgi:predicted anti-sigma-YlaC factor YlaD